MNTLKEIRLNNDLFQIEAAKLLGIDHSTLSAYENGTRTPSPEMLAKMANIYGVEYNEIFNAYIKTKGGKGK